MSDYEFWNELGNIFNAVVAYQRKTIEFNKRFVNPWIHMGTVFDKEGHNADTVSAYRKALEINPDDASSWQGLGDAYFKMGSFQDAATAYEKAIEMDPQAGWSYANLALTQATRQNYTEAINLYIRSLEIISDEKDRSMIWNRLGNVYRKVNDYENAFVAFQMADECDAANTGFSDPLDEVPAEQVPTLVEEEAPVHEVDDEVGEETEQSSAPITDAELEDALTTELMDTVDEFVADADAVAQEILEVDGVEHPAVEEQATDADALEEQPAEISESTTEAPGTEPVADPETLDEEAVLETDQVLETEQVDEEQTLLENVTEVASETAQQDFESEEVQTAVMAETQTEAVTEDAVIDEEASAVSEEIKAESPTETLTAVMSHAVETFADPNEFAKPTPVTPDETETTPVLAEAEIEPEAAPLGDVVVVAIDSLLEELIAETPSVEMEALPEVPVDAASATEPVDEAEVHDETDIVAEEVIEEDIEVHLETAEAIAVEDISQEDEATPIGEAETESNESIIQEIVELAGRHGSEAAYEEFLRDNTEPKIAATEESVALPQEELVEPLKNDVKLEPDTRNAHVWNELGNVYFNAGAYEDAIDAYKKAIELDAWFAWPYSNLALAYVQKEKYTDAVILYQRSIELFSNDKDKAVTWNRLGSVYRRLNDYDNAIASYQRADDLDPNNATRSLRSRFSLLGSFSAEPAPMHVS